MVATSVQPTKFLTGAGLAAFLALAPAAAVADTGDIIDDFLAGGTNVWWCSISTPGGALVGVVWADVDGDTVFDTQVVMTTLTGEARVEPESTTGKWYFHSFIDTNCGGAPPFHDRGRFRIHFVDILSPGFVFNDPNTWTFKSIPAARLRLSHDLCWAFDNPRYDDPQVHPVHTAQAYREIPQTDPIPATTDGANFSFSDTVGIKEINITTDFCENVLDDLILCDSATSANCAGTTDPPGDPGIVFLFDTSGSMGWSHEGVTGVPLDQQRLTLAKNAATPMLDILVDHNLNAADFGIARFPVYPWGISAGCNGQVEQAMGPVDVANVDTAKTVTVPGLQPAGNTPLLAGVGTALGMFTDEAPRAIVLLSDGYHNCPSSVTVSDSEVINIVNQAVAQSAKIFTIGFGRPTDVDHPLLEALAAETEGTFHDVTGPAFDPASWTPDTALQQAYAEILADALGLETGIDPLGVVKVGQTVTRKVAINELDGAVTFYLSWKVAQVDRLLMTVLSSDGQAVPTAGPGIRYHRGETYTVLTVAKDFLIQPGKVSATPWELRINGKNVRDAESEPYQYTVLLSSKIKMDASLNATVIAVGDMVTLTARLTAGRVPITGASVTASIVRPSEGMGNWLGKHRVDAAALSAVPAKVGPEILPGIARKFRLLTDRRKIALPRMMEPQDIALRDDGTQGDAQANDGIYTGRFNDTHADGTYTFHFRAEGTTAKASPFEREARLQRHVTVAPVPDKTEIGLTGRLVDKKRVRLTVTVVPRDRDGNLLGPRYAGFIRIEPEWGRLVGDVQDNLDGSYSQIVELPGGTTEPVEIGVRFKRMRTSVTWKGLDKPLDRGAIRVPSLGPAERKRLDLGPVSVPQNPKVHCFGRC